MNLYPKQNRRTQFIIRVAFISLLLLTTSLSNAKSHGQTAKAAGTITQDETTSRRKQAEALVEAGKYAAAIEVCETTLARLKNSKGISTEEHGNLLFQAGFAYSQMGNLKAAIEKLEKNIGIFKDNAVPLPATKGVILHLFLARVYYQKEMFQDAKSACEQCLMSVSYTHLTLPTIYSV